MTTTHPERRTGQRYRRLGNRYSTLALRREDGFWTFSPPDSDGTTTVSDAWVATNWTLIEDSAPQPECKAPDRTGCKAWCGANPNTPAGILYNSAPESVVNGKAFAREDFCDMDANDPRNVRWCSQRCKDLKLPPLESKPAETAIPASQHIASQNKGSLGPLVYGEGRPAPEAPKVPRKCMWRHAATKCSGPLAERHVGIAGKRESHGWCEGHYLEYERQAYARPQSGTPYAGPERLPRPKLAHVGGSHDEDLVTW